MVGEIMFTRDEIERLEKHGISKEEAERQIALINKGVKRPELVKPARLGDGIVSFDEKRKRELIKHWEEKSREIKAVKFVPASGAATRMFKTLNFIYHNFDKITLAEISVKAKSDKTFAQAELFFSKIGEFPFAEDIPSELLNFEANENLFPLLRFILEKDGLNFGDSPKGLIKFHKRDGKSFTPVEEHAYEAANVLSRQREKKLHFTISPRFEKRFVAHFDKTKKNFAEHNLSFEYSFQHPSTDTIVWDGEKLLRNKNGDLVFRPGGHGALIENLNELDADLIFIKNIDNVSKLETAQKSYEYKKLLGGYALYLAEKIRKILRKSKTGKMNSDEINDAIVFAEEILNADFTEEEKNACESELRKTLFAKLDKPLRVAGMVKNTGEPGGGPFWVKNENGTLNLQIVEKAQIDLTDARQKEILAASTHFNPVDLVCYVKNYNGEKFDLKKFVNPDYGIITEKHLEGRDVKVLELPGLWNAAMWDWITVFVDVPLFTFTPVKEVTDLLKEEHNG